jgi:hypothetical protein
VLGLLVLVLLAKAPPQVYFEQTTTTSVAGEAPGPGVRSRVWYAAQRMRMEAGGAGEGVALILRLDQGLAYRIDPARKEAVRLDLAALRTRVREDSAAAGMLMGGDASFRVSALPGTRRIAGFDCQGYRLRAGSTTMDVQVAPGAPARVDAFAEFLSWSGVGDAAPGLVEAIRALPGFPLETRSRVAVLDEVRETVSTITVVRVGPVEPARYDPPPGYRILDDGER